MLSNVDLAIMKVLPGGADCEHFQEGMTTSYMFVGSNPTPAPAFLSSLGAWARTKTLVRGLGESIQTIGRV